MNIQEYGRLHRHRREEADPAPWALPLPAVALGPLCLWLVALSPRPLKAALKCAL